MARKKRAEKPGEDHDPLANVVFVHREGPRPLAAIAAEEKFWKLFVARVIATDISEIDDVDGSA